MWARKGSREPPVGNLWNLRMGLRTKSVKLGSLIGVLGLALTGCRIR
jgi:hypothetical protein